MKTFLILVVSVVLSSLIVISKLTWYGLNPFLANLLILAIVILLMLSSFIIYLENNTKYKIIQAGILVICLSFSLIKLKSDFEKLSAPSNKENIYQKGRANY